MDAKSQYLEKIESLIYSSDKFNEMSFRLVLEGLVNKGGEEAEFLVVRFLTSQDVNVQTRINIIRVVGYLQSPHFLIPLKKIIDTENNIHLKKEAVISVAKYNDRRALNILNNALGKIKNTLLLTTINAEIAKIKRNNPIFALLPRFLEGEKDPKNMHITMGILKRILKPSDASTFTSYLNCGKPVIENASFDILCSTGNLNHRDAIMKFYQDRFNKIPCIAQPECEEFYMLALALQTYFQKFPELIEHELENLGTQLFILKDRRIRHLYVSILCKSTKQPLLRFMDERYDKDPDLREAIINEYSDNKAAFNLLFRKFETGDDTHKGLLIKSLLQHQKGVEYFYQKFDSLDIIEKSVVVGHLPYHGSHDLSDFFELVLQSDSPELKQALLKKMRTSQSLSPRIKDMLFDPAREADFEKMEADYISTVTTLYPLTSVKKILEWIAVKSFTEAKVTRFMEDLKKVGAVGMAYKFTDVDFIPMLFNRVMSYEQPDLNVLFLQLVSQIKTFDMGTYNGLNQSIGQFVNRRSTNIGKMEAEEVKKVRGSLKDLYEEIKKISDGIKLMDRIFGMGEEFDFERAREYVTKNSLCVALYIERMRHHLGKRLDAAGPDILPKWLDFYNAFPMLGQRMRDAIKRKAEAAGDGPVQKSLLRLHKQLPETPLKVVIRLESKHITTVLKEQCHELIPDFPVDIGAQQFNENDVLICDAETLKDFILKNTLPSQKLFLFLEKRSDFPEFKNYNPRPFFKSFSAFRIMKEILKELYL